MDISDLGEFAFIEKFTEEFNSSDNEVVRAVGDDCSVIDEGSHYSLISTELMLEGIAFDLTYTPLMHLGYKCIVAACSDILAMNGTPKGVLIGLGVSKRFTVENIEELYKGIKTACDDYNITLLGGDTSSSLTGLSISATAYGRVDKDKIAYRKGAKVNDIICVTGDLGGAYLGLKLLEREKVALGGNITAQPQLGDNKYPLQRYLRPELRSDIIETLATAKLTPTAMIDISDGLASDLIQICKNSSCGARVYLDKMPIASKCFSLADELKIDPVVAALNGGDDFELMFTLPIDRYNDVIKAGGIYVVGHITEQQKGVALTTPDGAEIAMQAPGFVSQSE